MLRLSVHLQQQPVLIQFPGKYTGQGNRSWPSSCVLVSHKENEDEILVSWLWRGMDAFVVAISEVNACCFFFFPFLSVALHLNQPISLKNKKE